jgi:hypothetical protein
VKSMALITGWCGWRWMVLRNGERYVQICTAMRMLRRSRRTVMNFIHYGNMVAVHVRGRWYVSYVSVCDCERRFGRGDADAA